MAEIALRGVRKSYGSTEVIHGVDIEVADGELIVIVGPSGCGKSTLLRMVAGLETVTQGEISIGKRVVNDLEPRERNIAMVFQNYALYPHMSVRANLAYGLKIAGMPRAEIEERTARAASMLQIEPYLDRKPRQLSGGQRQRVAMGRAIVREPDAFLFDEPLSNLDAKLRVQMRMEIKAMQQRLGVTSLYVTHDQVEAMTLADRMIVMNEGVAEQIGAPVEVYKNPATAFVAGFIGSPPMNFVPVTAGRLPKAPDDAHQFGARPEHLRFCAEGKGLLSGEVSFMEVLGAESLIHVELSGDSGEQIIVRVDANEPAPALGDKVGLTADAGHFFYFDKEGRRLSVG